MVNGLLYSEIRDKSSSSKGLKILWDGSSYFDLYFTDYEGGFNKFNKMNDYVITVTYSILWCRLLKHILCSLSNIIIEHYIMLLIV